jgi:hypothetical protein
MEWKKAEIPAGLEESVKKLAEGKITEAINQKEKHTRIEAVERAKTDGTPVRKRRPGRTSFEDRPPAPWGNFPLSELAVFVAIVLIIGSFIVRGDQGVVMFAAGLLLGTLAGLEVSIREHFAGFRSHSTLLAGLIAIVTITAIALAAGEVFVPLLLAAGLAVFGISFWSFREAFKRRSGGVSFR